MGRPNFDRMQRQQREIARWVGETATHLAYVSAGTYNPLAEAAGIGDTAYYVSRVISGLFSFASVPFTENHFAGGVVVTGDVLATLIDCVPTVNDEVVWQGVDYRVVGQPIPMHINGMSAYRTILRKGQSVP